jgi:ATP-binding cassette subfamily B protein
MVAISLVAAIIGAACNTAVPLVVRHVVDQLVDSAKTGKQAHVGVWIGVLIGFALLSYACTFSRRYAAGRLSLDVQYDMRADVFDSLTKMDGPTQDKIDTGQIVSRSITDIGIVQGLLQIIPALTGNAILFVMSLVVMAVLSPVLTLVTVLTAPALWFVASRSRRDLFPANWSSQQQSGVLVGHVEAAVTGVRVVKGFGQENRELNTLDDEAHILYRLRMRVVRLQAKYSAALQSIPALGQVGVLMLGGYLALHGHITLGTFLAFSTYLAQLVGPVRMLTTLLTVGQQARAGTERVLEIVDTRPTIVDPPNAVDIPIADDGSVDVEFDDVHFAYDEDRPVLRGLSLRIERGETVAIVGGSGSGKSTMVMLLDRLYDPQSGAVLVGGVDVRAARMDSTRSVFGIVFEDTFLFSDSIKANIAYGSPDASDEQIEAAAAMAQADGFIRALPYGYDTVVGERGLTLSGGQRQRIALARALLCDPSVLVLDDATSAIDPRVEARIVEALREERAGRSTVLVAHRSSTLELADRIVVLDKGVVAAMGTRAELEANSPLFRRLMSAAPGANEHAALLAESGLDGEHGGVTEHLWVGSRQIEDRGAGALSRQVISGTLGGGRAGMGAGGGGGGRGGGGRGRGGGGGMGGGGGGMLTGVPASPQLLKRVAALPPATGEPEIDPALARAGDSQFGLGRLLAPVRAVLSLGLALVALDTVAQLIVPALVRGGIDDGVTRGDVHTLTVISIFALVVILLDWAISRAGQLVTGRTGERLLYLLRVKTFAHLQRLGLDYYERELGGRIMTRMTTDIDALSNFLQTGLTTTLVSILTLFGVLVALIALNAGLSLVLVAMLPILIVATLIFRAKAVPAYVEARERVSAVNAQLQEEMFGLRTTQSFRREQRNTDVYLKASMSYRDSRLRAQRYISTYFPFIQFLSDIAGAAILLFGASRLRDGTLTSGALIAFFLYLDAFFSPIQQLSQVFDGYQQASVGLSRLRDLLRTKTTTPPPEHPAPVGELTGAISMRDVHFRYTGAPSDAIDGIDLEIAAGETVALVGETGAGKSSLVKLIARFYDVTGGAVSVDGHDVRGFDLPEYRSRLGVVPQEPYLSPGTIRDAIAYGRPNATDAEVEAAARAVGAHPMISSLSNGYLHDVGERGGNLSAGQRQLIALARAQLVQPDILLLDEATAALDLASEAIVTAATERLARKCTTIVVAHRLTTAARADRIIVLDKGKVVQAGPHEQLLQEDGAYASLWAAYADRPVDVSDSVAS